MVGTFITEWDAGAEICNEILADKSSVQNVVLQLTRIAKYHGFEGWLLNIENKINPEQVTCLLHTNIKSDNFVLRVGACYKISDVYNNL